MNEVRSRWQWHQNWSFVFTSLAWLRNKTSKPFVVVEQSKTLKNGQGFSRKVAPKSERSIQCRQWHGMWGKSPIKWAAHMEGFGLKHMEGSKRSNRMWKLKTDMFLLSTRRRQPNDKPWQHRRVNVSSKKKTQASQLGIASSIPNANSKSRKNKTKLRPSIHACIHPYPSIVIRPGAS